MPIFGRGGEFQSPLGCKDEDGSAKSSTGVGIFGHCGVVPNVQDRLDRNYESC